jgi:hypothetical protein
VRLWQPRHETRPDRCCECGYETSALHIPAERSAHAAQAHEILNAQERAWRESERAYVLKRKGERREEWRAHFLRLADVHTRLDEENRSRAARLIGGRGGV